MLREAVSCFLQQSNVDAELVILNNHPVPLVCDLPRVRVVNESGHKTLGAQRTRLAELAQGEFIRVWDDDDLYMPWSLEQSMEIIGKCDAAKPARSWAWTKGHLPKLDGNVFESSWIFRKDFVLKHGYGLKDDHEHDHLFASLRKYGSAWDHQDFDYGSSYIYRWGHGAWHISGSCGNGQTPEQRTLTWQRHNQDTGNGVPITPVDLNEYWKMMVGVAPKLLELFDRSGVKVRV